jgi:hypothetical protein
MYVSMHTSSLLGGSVRRNIPPMPIAMNSTLQIQVSLDEQLH